MRLHRKPRRVLRDHAVGREDGLISKVPHATQDVAHLSKGLEGGGCRCVSKSE